MNDCYILQVSSGDCFLYSSWPSPCFKSSIGVLLVLVEFILPLIIMAYCYIRIIWILTRRIGSNLGSGSQLVDKFQLARINVVKTFLLVGICFIICWSNNQVYYLMSNLGYDADWNSDFYKFTVVMVFLNCTINPFIYLIKYQDFQMALKKSLGCQNFNDNDESDIRGVSVSSSRTSVIPTKF